MIRVTIELLPGGDASRATAIGAMEIANIARRPDGTGDYAVALKKAPPFKSPLAEAWLRRKIASADGLVKEGNAFEDEELITAVATGHRGNVYALLLRALVACGLDRQACQPDPA